MLVEFPHHLEQRAGAILQARIPVVVYGALDPKAGAVDSLYHLLTDQRLNQIGGGL